MAGAALRSRGRSHPALWPGDGPEPLRSGGRPAGSLLRASSAERRAIGTALLRVANLQKPGFELQAKPLATARAGARIAPLVRTRGERDPRRAPGDAVSGNTARRATRSDRAQDLARAHLRSDRRASRDLAEHGRRPVPVWHGQTAS